MNQLNISPAFLIYTSKPCALLRGQEVKEPHFRAVCVLSSEKVRAFYKCPHLHLATGPLSSEPEMAELKNHFLN